MTVPSQISRDQQAGDGISTDFTVPFRILSATDMLVLSTVGGVTTTLVLTTDYTIPNVGATSTMVNFVVAPVNGAVLVFLRQVPITQETDYVPNDPFPAESHERALDKLTMIAQQTGEITDRAIVLPPQTVGVSTQLPGPVPLNLLRWNAAANALENALPPAIATVADGAVVDATVSPIAAIQGTKLNFLPGGTFAVNRTVQDKLREIISVKDFGALGDGVADDTLAIQRAIDYAATFSGSGGANVVFPAGRYNYTTVTVSSNNTVLSCNGEVYLTKTSTTGLGIVVGNQVSRVFGVELRGFQLGSTVAGVSGNLVSFINVGQSGVSSLTQTAAFGVPWIGLRMTNASQVFISDCQFQDCASDGIIVEDAVDLYLDNSRSDSHGGSGFVFNKLAGWYGSNATAYDNGVHGFSGLNTFAVPVLTTQNQHWFPSNCVGDTSGNHNWNITQLSQARFTSCWGATHRVTTVDLHGFALSNCIDVELVGCTATNNNASGVFILSSCSHVRITGGGYHGNGVAAGSSHKVGIFSDNANLAITGTTCTDDLRAAIALPRVQTHGIRLTGASAGVTVTGCDLRGNLTGPMDVPTTANGLRLRNCEDGSTASYASAVSVTVSPCDEYFDITGTAGVFDILPNWKGRRLVVSFSSTAALQDVGGGGNFRLPAPSVTPGANGTATIVYSGSRWLLESFSVNDGV